MPLHNIPLPLRLPCLLLALWLLLAMTAARAEGKSVQAWRQEAAAWLARQAEQAYPDALARVEMGPLDSRLRLDSCADARFFLPAGARLWSGGSLGMKCVAPATWTLYLTYQVQLAGPALAPLRPLPARHLLGQEDVSLAQVRYEQDPGAYVREVPRGATTQRPLLAQQPILIHDLVLPDVIQAGARVRVRVQGQGFSVSQEGKALNAARAGGSVRVRMPTGRIVGGMATPSGEVEIRP